MEVTHGFGNFTTISHSLIPVLEIWPCSCQKTTTTTTTTKITILLWWTWIAWPCCWSSLVGLCFQHNQVNVFKLIYQVNGNTIFWSVCCPWLLISVVLTCFESSSDLVTCQVKIMTTTSNQTKEKVNILHTHPILDSELETTFSQSFVIKENQIFCKLRAFLVQN